MKVADASQMREMDRQTIEDFHLSSIVLMENAAKRVVDIVHDKFGPLKNKKIHVVCGHGNNGGDGLVIARHLQAHFKALVKVWLSANPETFHGELAANYKIALSYGLEFYTASEINLAEAEIIVDALFGTGIHGAVIGDSAKIIEAINDSGKPVVSVDAPSGLDVDTGKAEGAVVKAKVTVTFALPKYGLLDYPGADYVGELIVSDIGMPVEVMKAPHIKLQTTVVKDVATWLAPRANGRDINKGKFGHVILFAGAKGFVGAPIMVAEAATRTGAGLVTLVIPENIETQVISHLSPVVMTQALKASSQGTFSNGALDQALSLTKKATAVGLGPGLGKSDDLSSFVRELVSQCSCPLVIDADALNILADEPDHGRSIIRSRKALTILTPHPGEMGRLLGIKTEAVQADRKAVVTKAADFFGCVVLLKGARTLIAAPDGTMYLNTTGNAGMATGGAGDVLTGIIAALLSQHLEPLHAASCGVYIHGLAGDLFMSKTGGNIGMIATDLISRLPKAIAQCQSPNLNSNIELVRDCVSKGMHRLKEQSPQSLSPSLL